MKKNFFSLLSGSIICIAIFGCEKKVLDTQPTVNVSAFKVTNIDASLPANPNPLHYYVSANGDNTHDGLSPANGHPWKSIRYASEHSKPGDVIYVMDEGGTFLYTPPAGSVALIDTSGTAAQHITFTPYGSEHPKIQSSGDIFATISIIANYIDFNGIEVIGNNAGLEAANGGRSGTITAANNAEQQYRANNNIATSVYARFNTGGINVGDKNKFTHHVTVTNCKVHDCPRGGIGAEHADWVTFTGNVVYNNCLYTMYGSSGMGTKDSFNFDGDVTSNKFLINKNICHDNQTLCTYAYKPEATLSDGNGIIIDVNNGSINADATINYANPYNGKTRIENNICYNNGGGGIHIVEAHNIYVVNNTTYNNGLNNNGGATVGYAEMDSYGSYDVNYYSNIMYASSRAGSTCDGYAKPKSANGTVTTTGNIVYDYNVLYNNKSLNPVANVHFKNTDPKFISLTIPNFQLSDISSSAANTGLGSTPHYSYYDILNIQRPKVAGSYPDCGAYESF
jgi:hypothetical protein